MHIPVLLQETIKFLNVKKDGKYIDGTFGFGGHSKQILDLGGEILGIDIDQQSLEVVREKFKNLKKLKLVHGNFRNIQKIAKQNGFVSIDGILLDLGLSSWQIDSSGKGFSFLKDEPLDMRMDQSLGVKAEDLIKVLNKGELHDLLLNLGEESLASDIGLSLVRTRGVKNLETTRELAEIVEEVYHKIYKTRSKKHPATKVFQALRIAVNDELNALKEFLPQAVELLRTKGRLVIITFHSLEDKIVKDFFKNTKGIQNLTKKPIIPTREEIRENPRSRSAKLRIAEKK